MPAPLSSLCYRQWDSEEKSRKQRLVVLAEQDGQGLENDEDDGASTKGGVLHEEDFVETKAGAGAGGHDVEAPRGSSQQDAGLLAVLRVVDWWKVRAAQQTQRTSQYHKLSDLHEGHCHRLAQGISPVGWLRHVITVFCFYTLSALDTACQCTLHY